MKYYLNIIVVYYFYFMWDSILKVLERKGSVTILRLLYPDRECIYTEILDEVKKYGMGTSALYSTLKTFLDYGVIEEKVERGVARVVLRRFKLTEKGKKLIEGLLKLEKELSEDP